jgi:predicted GNAT superfamily acetyltransferase
MTDGIVIRKCTTLEEFHLCVELQKEVWQEADLEIEPITAFVVAAQTGGQVLGAFDGSRLAAFTLAVVGVRDKIVYLHSHMTGVHRDYRDRGIGRCIKLFQRDEALSRDIRIVRWTFDPLEFRNAYFNLNRLGAICREFLPNLYGVTTSPLHRDLPTDRLVAEWQLDAPRAVAAAAGLKLTLPEHYVTLGMPEYYVYQENPAASLAIHESEPPDPAALQTRLRTEFTRHFQKGYAAIAVKNDAQPAYVLVPWSDF